MGAILPFPGNIWHCLETSVSQLGMGGGGEQGYWRLVSRGQNCFQTSYNAQHSPLQQRIIQPQKPVVLRWRNPVLQPHFAGGGGRTRVLGLDCVCARAPTHVCAGDGDLQSEPLILLLAHQTLESVLTAGLTTLHRPLLPSRG